MEWSDLFRSSVIVFNVGIMAYALLGMLIGGAIRSANRPKDGYTPPDSKANTVFTVLYAALGIALFLWWFAQDF